MEIKEVIVLLFIAVLATGFIASYNERTNLSINQYALERYNSCKYHESQHTHNDSNYPIDCEKLNPFN